MTCTVPLSDTMLPLSNGVWPAKGWPLPDALWPRTSAGLKYSAMPRRCLSVVAFSSHISRKNAIMAVTKSAYATFQAPPWWPASPVSSRRTMVTCWVPLPLVPRAMRPCDPSLGNTKWPHMLNPRLTAELASMGPAVGRPHLTAG